MSPEQISQADTSLLIRRLAEIENAQLNLFAARGSEQRRAALKKEHARIWQEFSVRRRSNKLRMSPKRIRARVSERQFALMTGTA